MEKQPLSGREDQRRDLVAKRFTTAGGHDRQCIFFGKDVGDDLSLERAKAIVAENVFQDRVGNGGQMFLPWPTPEELFSVRSDGILLAYANPIGI